MNLRSRCEGSVSVQMVSLIDVECENCQHLQVTLNGVPANWRHSYLMTKARALPASCPLPAGTLPMILLPSPHKPIHNKDCVSFQLIRLQPDTTLSDWAMYAYMPVNIHIKPDLHLNAALWLLLAGKVLLIPSPSPTQNNAISDTQQNRWNLGMRPARDLSTTQYWPK